MFVALGNSGEKSFVTENLLGGQKSQEQP